MTNTHTHVERERERRGKEIRVVYDQLEDLKFSLVNLEDPLRRNQMKCLLSLSLFDEEDTESQRELITHSRSSNAK